MARLKRPTGRKSEPESAQLRDLRAGIERTIRERAGAKTPPSPLALRGQPFDRELLALSPLYKKSRQLFRRVKGEFEPALVSSPRTLSSPILLTPRIEYSPTESELFWAATDPHEKKRPETLLRLRTYTASLFHEQSHRILWDFLPPPPSSPRALRSYLNFTESLVVALDMALGDQLGPRRARLFYLAGSIYDPGTHALAAAPSRREYRNYLHAAAYATYLNLELYSPDRIPEAIELLFPGEAGQYACHRALQLDEAFVTRTNPAWQKKHASKVARALARPGHPPLNLGSDPLDNRVFYLTTELWLERFGI